jgi:2,4-dienoyl-CoA reductase-like NADH-dependent reductase (Old Yellow Enzyme family)
MSLQLIDPLLQQFQLKNTTLRNRVVSTSHEPSYTEDGMPKRATASTTRKRPRAASG